MIAKYDEFMGESEKKPTRFTFKTTQPTGRYKSFYTPYHEIKLNGVVVGSIDPDTYKRR